MPMVLLSATIALLLGFDSALIPPSHSTIAQTQPDTRKAEADRLSEQAFQQY
jgi:hypothetical protein